MIDDYSGVNKKTIEPLLPILEHWVSFVRQMYLEAKETPYSYKERTNIGALASAAAIAGWFPLQECDSSKRKHGLSYDGRIDLLLFSQGLRRRYLFEAKLTVNSLDRLPGRIKTVCSKARSDAASLPKDSSREQFATIFVIPRFEEKCNKFPEDEINNAIRLCKNQNPDFIAYTFPGRSERKSTDHMDDGKCAYGVILFGFRI